MVVSVSFQFVGFLLTYVLHTTHAAKYGSRVGLGLTLIQFGFNLRSRAEELLETGRFPTDPSDPEPTSIANEDEAMADNALKAFWGPNSPWPQPIPDPDHPDGQPIIIHSTHEAELFAQKYNTTLTAMLGLPSASDVGRANEYFSFMLMSIGWFLVLTSVGGWWRVKRFERGLRSAQQESEHAQAAANPNRDGGAGGSGDEGLDAELFITTTEPTAGPGPTSLAYYTSTFRETMRGANEIRRGFFGMRGRPIRRGGGGGGGHGHTPLPQDDEHELFDAERFGLEPMASDEGTRTRSRGLWGA